MTARKTVKCIQLAGWPIFRQLQLEEYLLRHKAENFLILNKNMPGRSIVMGFSAKPADLLHLEAVRRDSIQTIRRFTGGGTVIVDSSTVFVSFIMNAVDVGCNPYPREIMTWTETVYQPVFSSLLPATCEPFRLREHDYVIGEKKVAGNAQSIVKGRWIHHTSFLWNFTAANMSYLKMPSKRPAYRSDRSHTDFLLPLSPLIPSPDDFLSRVSQSMGSQYDMLAVSAEEAQLLVEESRHPVADFQCRTVIEEV